MSRLLTWMHLTPGEDAEYIVATRGGTLYEIKRVRFDTWIASWGGSSVRCGTRQLAKKLCEEETVRVRAPRPRNVAH